MLHLLLHPLLQLNFLDLQNNEFTGPLPEAWSNLTSLVGTRLTSCHWLALFRQHVSKAAVYIIVSACAHVSNIVDTGCLGQPVSTDVSDSLIILLGCLLLPIHISCWSCSHVTLSALQVHKTMLFHVTTTETGSVSQSVVLVFFRLTQHEIQTAL